jgi:F1F0 ATPase subunit 2
MGWLVAFGAGVLAGASFFAGLWWTVRRGLSSGRPGLWSLGSLPLRAGLVLAVFHLGTNGDWTRLPLCVLGFVVARGMVVRAVRNPERANESETEEVTDGA